jgi:uncharacterized protein YpmS
LTSDYIRRVIILETSHLCGFHSVSSVNYWGCGAFWQFGNFLAARLFIDHLLIISDSFVEWFNFLITESSVHGTEKKETVFLITILNEKLFTRVDHYIDGTWSKRLTYKVTLANKYKNKKHISQRNSKASQLQVWNRDSKE